MIARAMLYIRAAWYARVRRVDVRILWPTCKAKAPNISVAKAAFAVHAFGDPAWLFLGKEEVYRFIDEELV